MNTFLIVLLSTLSFIITGLLTNLFNSVKVEKGEFLRKSNLGRFLLCCVVSVIAGLTVWALENVKKKDEQIPTAPATTDTAKVQKPQTQPEETKLIRQDSVKHHPDTQTTRFRAPRIMDTQSSSQGIINEPVAVKPPKKWTLIAEKSISVYGLSPTRINVEAGDSIFVRAEGIIKVGEIYGNSTPAGIERLRSEKYCIEKNISHGALLIRVGEQLRWAYCGERFAQIATASGELFFQVNDNDQGNNLGHYLVTCFVYR
jgi:hypothetical protein